MSSLQELNGHQIGEALSAAAARQLPATLTVKMDGGWATYHTRIIAVAGDKVLLEQPPMQAGEAPHEFVPGEKLGVAFKLKHYKHLFTADMTGFADYSVSADFKASMIAIACPANMQRLQRRVFFRAAVPPNRIVRASFWLGGREAEPAAGQSHLPIWSGKVTNISAGGFQMGTSAEAAAALEVGDMVGVRIVFGAGADHTVYVDAQFRHLQRDSAQTVLGFQFTGMGQTDEGKEALRIISLKVGQFHQTFQDLQSLSDRPA